jgi:peptidoglycan glycosyltransferase
MTRSLNRITLLVLMAFATVAVSLVYWSAFGSDSMLARNDNPRLVEAERALIRGGIYDRGGMVLVQTVKDGVAPSGKSVVRRDYVVPEAVGAVGYYSLVHGVGGVEAAYDAQLRGNDIRTDGDKAAESLLHVDQVGSDIRLTISADLQKSVLSAIKDKQAAVIAIEVPSVAVLAMVSSPTFDPNTLDQNFNALQKDPASPLLNRVTQGSYQPGGALETVILAALMGERVDVSARTSGTMSPVMVDGQALSCAQDGIAISTSDAYTLACPALFADAAAHYPEAVYKAMDAFGLLRAPVLENFETVRGKPILPLSSSQPPIFLRAEGAGQGLLTVTPFQMALVAATIANHGNAITPRLGDGTRGPGASEWTALPTSQEQPAIVTHEVADMIGEAMGKAVESGAAKAAARPNLTIRGHASIAYIGPDHKQAAWFIGYVDLADGRAIAIAVVINDADVSTAAEVGGMALAEAVKVVE